MNITIGFGSIERQFEEDEEAAIRAHCKDVFGKQLDPHYLTEDSVDNVRDFVAKRSKALRREADENKTAADYPDRYSYYWPVVLSDASRVVVILRCSHINRRHAMSPDGWAMMQTERLIHVPFN